MSVELPEPLRSDALAPLWTKVRDRLERTGFELSTNPVRLSGLDDVQLEAVCGLLGRRRPAGRALSVRLDHLDARLRAGAAQAGLLDTVEALGGPLVDRRAERAARLDERDALWSGATAHAEQLSPELVTWIESLRRRGTLTRLAPDDPPTLVAAALDVVAELVASAPDRSGSPLPVVAAQRLGDAHALDDTTPLGSLVLDGVTFLAGDEYVDPWASVGIDADLLSVTALTLGLPGTPGSIAAAAASAGEPLRVTHRMLERGFGLDAGALETVWVCENPAFVRLAADRLGSGCAPMVCSEGQANRATRRLLGMLASVGVELRVHADFDTGGIVIVNGLIAGFGATPWRMGASDYEAALEGPTLPLAGSVAATPWDPALATAMAEHGRAVHEEAIAETLLADLSHP